MRRVINLLLGRRQDARSRHEVDRRVNTALHDLNQVQREIEQIVREIANDRPHSP